MLRLPVETVVSSLGDAFEGFKMYYSKNLTCLPELPYIPEAPVSSREECTNSNLIRRAPDITSLSILPKKRLQLNQGC